MRHQLIHISLLALLFVFITHFLSTDSAAQLASNWNISSFGNDLHLDDVNVLELDMDASGNLWMATTKGLMCFDGYQIKHRVPNDRFPGSFPRCIMVSSNGSIWVGGDHGPHRFDPTTETFHTTPALAGIQNRSVRRIHEDPDGTIWFCCDTWPDSASEQGLASYHNGTLKIYSQKDGLPSDLVLNYFLTSDGQRFALTRSGLAQWSGPNWVDPLKSTRLSQTGQAFWTATESEQHGVIFSGDDDLLVLTDGEWSKHKSPNHFLKLTTDKDGEILTFEETNDGQFGFLRWNGDKFVAAARTDHRPDSTWVQTVRAFDQDGSIWCGGLNYLVRWAPTKNEWSLLPQRGERVFLDQQGNVWLQQSTNTLVFDGDTWSSPEPNLNLIEDEQGDLWRTNYIGKLERRLTESWQPLPNDKIGLAEVLEIIAPTSEAVWLIGKDVEGKTAFAIGEGGRWRHIVHQELMERTIIESWRGSANSIWCMLATGDNLRSELVRVFPDHLE